MTNEKHKDRWLWYPGDFEIRHGLLQNFNGKNEVLTGQRTGTWMIAIGTSSLRDITFLINLPCLK